MKLECSHQCSYRYLRDDKYWPCWQSLPLNPAWHTPVWHVPVTWSQVDICLQRHVELHFSPNVPEHTAKECVEKEALCIWRRHAGTFDTIYKDNHEQRIRFGSWYWGVCRSLWICVFTFVVIKLFKKANQVFCIEITPYMTKGEPSSKNKLIWNVFH